MDSSTYASLRPIKHPQRMRFTLLLIAAFFQLSTTAQMTDYWQLSPQGGITLDLTQDSLPFTLPHSDHIEMSGRKVSCILDYTIQADKSVSVERDFIFPQIRRFVRNDEPAWKRYRAYFRRQVGDDVAGFSVSVDSTLIVPGAVDSIHIDGMLIFYHKPASGLRIVRTFYPSTDQPVFEEMIEVQNSSSDTLRIDHAAQALIQAEKVHAGAAIFSVLAQPDQEQSGGFKSFSLAPDSSQAFIIHASASFNEVAVKANPFEFPPAPIADRQAYLTEMRSRLVLESPDPVINELFAFSKIRTSESIFDGSFGPIHSPGGGNYYLGTWANDQVEYHGPFAPYLGYPLGNEAALNTYRKFASAIPQGDEHIPYAFEVNGLYAMDHLDRGDAAMIAYGASHYALALGDEAIARELWPLIKWSLGYNHRMRNEAGAVRSESDEMEGRIPTGEANLSTSTLYYGGLKMAGRLAYDLGDKAFAKTCETRAKDMANVINNYFGAEVDGLQTYQYFEGHPYLRHWIALPLTMDLHQRADATVEALFEKLWTDDGVLVELNPDEPQTLFWDRATLYALRGAFRAGASDRAYERLSQFSRKRLLGNHVPYVIEAYPENDKRHLAAESALYCRIITEGILGIDPLGLSSFRLSPKLPTAWNKLSLKRLALQGKEVDIYVVRAGEGYDISVKESATGRVLPLKWETGGKGWIVNVK